MTIRKSLERFPDFIQRRLKLIFHFRIVQSGQKLKIKETFILIKLLQSTIPKLEREVRFKSVAGFPLWQPICITIRNTLVQNKPFHLLQNVLDTPV